MSGGEVVRPRCPACSSEISALYQTRVVARLYAYDGVGYRLVKTELHESGFTCPTCSKSVAHDELEASEMLQGGVVFENKDQTAKS